MTRSQSSTYDIDLGNITQQHSHYIGQVDDRRQEELVHLEGSRIARVRACQRGLLMI